MDREYPVRSSNVENNRRIDVLLNKLNRVRRIQMRVLFIVILGGDLVRSTEHLGVAYISAYLQEKGYDCTILEVYGMEDKKHLEEVLEKRHDVVGFTTTCVNMKPILGVAELVKQKYEDTHIMMGGHMATFWGTEILERYPYVDSIIRGEGEITTYELVKSIEEHKSFENIDGLSFRQDGEIIKNKDRALIENLDELPFPVRDQFALHNNRAQYLRVCSSRGCLGKCGFCSSFVGREQKDFRWRGRSPRNVVDEIELLVKKYDFHTYDFIDSTFEDPGPAGKERIAELAHELIDRKLNIFYNCCFRAENWSDDDKELLQLLVDSGLEKVNIGFESGNDRGLRLLCKRARSRDNDRVIKVLANFKDIYITFGFIMFHPDSIYEDLKDNADFLYHTGIGQVIRHYFWKLEVYPSTIIEKRLIDSKRITENYDLCDGMYEYEFLDQKVKKISDMCQEFLKVQEVWDFEIFDILIHTFISRMKKKYKKSEIIGEIEELANFVYAKRAAMAKFNHDFFIDIYENYETTDVNEKKTLLKRFIKSNMDEIGNREYRLGKSLIRRGYELVKSS